MEQLWYYLQIDTYKKFLWSLPGFENTEFKQDQSEYIPFAKLICKVREELFLFMWKVDPKHGGHSRARRMA